MLTCLYVCGVSELAGSLLLLQLAWVEFLTRS
jgi:hypothetical protein